jgi:hypothetical protein
MSFSNGLLAFVIVGSICVIVAVLLNFIPYFRIFVDAAMSLFLLFFVIGILFIPVFNHGLQYYFEHILEYLFKPKDYSNCVVVSSLGISTIIGIKFGSSRASVAAKVFMKKVVFVDFILAFIGAILSGGLVFFGTIVIFLIITSVFGGNDDGGTPGIFIPF